MKKLFGTVALLTAVALAALAGLLGDATARADSVGCTAAPGPFPSYVCLGIYGESRYVSSFRVSRNKYRESICNYKAKVIVTAPDGRRWVYRSPFHRGCTFNTAWMDMRVQRRFPHESVACGRWFEMGRWIPGKPCNRILR